MAASPITADDLAPVTEGTTACNHLAELANTRAKVQQFLAWMLTNAGNIDTDFINNLLEFALPGAGKEGWIVRANPTTGLLELASNNEETGNLLIARSLRINRLQTTSAVVGDRIVFIGSDWVRHTPFYGAPTSGGTTVPAAASGGTLTAAHGLSQAPGEFRCLLECATAEHGYAIGDRVDALSLKGRTSAPENFTPVIVFADASLVGAVFNDAGGGTYRIVNKTTPTIVNTLTPANWNVKFYATY